MGKMLKEGELWVLRGVIYLVVKIDNVKGLFLLEARKPSDEMHKRVAKVIEHTGYDILKVRENRARLKKDNLAKRVDGDEEEDE